MACNTQQVLTMAERGMAVTTQVSMRQQQELSYNNQFSSTRPNYTSDVKTLRYEKVLTMSVTGMEVTVQVTIREQKLNSHSLIIVSSH